MKKILFLTALFCFDAVAQANKTELDITYLCVAEKASGFVLEEGDWVPQRLASDSKYVLKKKGGQLYSLTEFGRNYPSVKNCEQSLNGTFINCKNVFGSLRFSTKSKRFLKTYLLGYVSGDDVEGDTPHIEIGVCTTI